MKSAFFPGSFHPFTVGHKSVVDRALAVFDRVVVGIGVNSGKPKAQAQADAGRIRELFRDTPAVEVTVYDGLTALEARRFGCGCLLRGVRSVADFEYERTLADANRNIFGIETFILYADPATSWVSSSLVRELERYGIDTTRFTL